MGFYLIDIQFLNIFNMKVPPSAEERENEEQFEGVRIAERW